MKYLGEEGLKTLIQKIKNSVENGNGNVSSGIINSIMVVDELPEEEVEGVLYLVKESATSDDETTNLYDASTATVLSAYIDPDAKTIVQSNSGTSKTTYLAVEPNTTYKITKTSSVYFGVGTCADEPVIGGSLTNATFDSSGVTETTITTGETDKYLAIYYCKTIEDSLSEEELRNSIVVTKVS